MARTQAQDAQYIYDSRSDKYDDSWHVRFARHMIELISPQPGQKVLDLACGTGLATTPAAQAVGPSGLVIGVDISSGMLAQAEKKLEQQSDLKNVSFHQHSITDLDSLEILKGKEGTFDLITCLSALVLLPGPGQAVQQWTKYLKPGGKLLTDVTHIQSQVLGVVFERVGRKLEAPIPSYRLNFEKPDDLKHVMEIAGLKDVKIVPVAQEKLEGTEDLKDYLDAGAGSRVLKIRSVEEADERFDSNVDGHAWQALGKAEIRERAKEVFREEWAKVADADGKVRVIDCVYVGIGQKP